ncbi:MAG TPA: triose-phosphate isomerase, partial [Thermoplasmata archaeon]
SSVTDAAPLGRPLLLLNLKAYPGCLGPGAERLGLHLQQLGRRAGVAVAIAPATPDLGRLARALSIPVLAQHADAGEAGARTGWTVPATIRAAGGRGSLLNHSEHPMEDEGIAAGVVGLRSLDLVPVVCAKDVADAGRLARFRPPYLAVEPPELIGGDRSVSTTRPEVVSETVDVVRRVAPRTLVLCGAGVHDRDDVRRAIELGSQGVLVASAVTKAPSPRSAIAELLRGF